MMKHNPVWVNVGMAFVLAVGLLSLAYQPALALPAKYFVVYGGSDSGTCSVANPCSLAHALSLAQDNESIYVGQGIFTGTGSNMIDITHSIHLIGGWDGVHGGMFPTTDPSAYLSVLDGENARRVVRIEPGLSPSIVGFTIYRGNANGTTADCHQDATINGCGGGIYSYNAAPYISNNVIKNNAAAASGVSTNFSHGGGIYIERPSGNITIKDNLFMDNMANSNPNGSAKSRGGGLYIGPNGAVSVTITIQGNSFRHNYAYMGGAIYLYELGNSPIAISSNSFINNYFTYGSLDGFGGVALYVQGSSGDISHNTFSNNDSNGVGAPGVYFGASAFNFYDNVMSLNGDTGAGVEFNAPLTSTPLFVYNNIIAQTGNPAFSIGVDSGQTGTMVFYNNTIYGFSTSYYTAVVETKSCSPCQTISFLNNIIDNYQTAFNNVDYAHYNLTGAFVAFGTVTDASNNLHADPKFRSVATLDLHLTGASPAFNAANCGIFSACAADDFEGDARPLWGGYDIGADEFDIKSFLPLVIK